MLGLAILLAFNLLGALLHELGLPLPGAVIGLLLLAACLFVNVIKLKWVEDAADFLLGHMLLFFAPVIVGVLPVLPLLQMELAAFLVTMIGSLLAVMLTTGWTAHLLALWIPRRRHG